MTGTSGRQLQKVGEADAPAPPRWDGKREVETVTGRLRWHVVHILMNSSTAAGRPCHHTHLRGRAGVLSHCAAELARHWDAQAVVPGRPTGRAALAVEEPVPQDEAAELRRPDSEILP
jgi:hypothetical protein